MNDEEKIRIIKSSLDAIEELQTRLIVASLFMMLSSVVFCVCILLYNYFSG